MKYINKTAEETEIDVELSELCSDTHDSGNFDAFGVNETAWIEDGKIQMAY